MLPPKIQSRRVAVGSSVFGILAASVSSIAFAEDIAELPADKERPEELFHRYPSIDDAIVSEVVGASHFNLERVKELVDQRPELARATWDWAFGDWETALGAASHVGRRDIIDYLISRGARPDIFTFATMGAIDVIKPVIEAHPAMLEISGPHGISLLQHAKNGLRSDTLTSDQKSQGEQLVSFLESRQPIDAAETLPLTEAEQLKFLGDYKYGDGAAEGLSVRQNMRKQPCLGRIGTFGGALYQIRENTFSYNGCPSVEISFEVENGKVHAVTVREPELTLKAKKI